MGIHNRRYYGDGNYMPRGPFTLNRDSPQAQGLRFWCPVIGDPKLLRDFAEGQTVATDEPLVLNPFGGQAYNSEGSTSAITFASDIPFIRAKTAATVSMWIITTAAGGNKTLLLRGDARTYRMRDITSAYQLAMGDSTTIVAGAPASRDGAVRCHVGRLDGANVDYFIDGINRGTATDAVAMRNAASSITAGGSSGTAEGIRWFDQREYHRALSDAECFAIFDPSTRWDLYYELGRISYFFASPAVAAAGESFPPWKTSITHLLVR